MKLMTLNCHSWQEENQISKLKYLAAVIIKENYDVVALQEVSQLRFSKKIYKDIREDNFLHLLSLELKKLGGNYFYRWDFSHISYDNYEEGVGILFKGKIVEKSGGFLGSIKDTNFWKTRKFSRVSIEVNEEIIDFYSCHMGWWKDEENSFEKQADHLIKIIQERNNYCFLMGDFNNDAGKREEGYDYLIKKGLIDTYEIAKKKCCGITVKGIIEGWEKKSLNDKRIDLILTNRETLVEESKVVFNKENYFKISDHFGVSLKVN